MVLELKTPNLRVLRMAECNIETLRISAPRLEELTFFDDQPEHIKVEGGELSCVRSLQVELYSHKSHYGKPGRTRTMLAFSYSSAVHQSQALTCLLMLERYGTTKSHSLETTSSFIFSNHINLEKIQEVKLLILYCFSNYYL